MQCLFCRERRAVSQNYHALAHLLKLANSLGRTSDRGVTNVQDSESIEKENVNVSCDCAKVCRCL